MYIIVVIYFKITLVNNKGEQNISFDFFYYKYILKEFIFIFMYISKSFYIIEWKA